MNKEKFDDPLYEFEILKYEIECTASRMLTCMDDAANLETRFKKMQKRQDEWIARGKKISSSCKSE